MPAVDGLTVDRNELIANGTITEDLPYWPGALGCALSHVGLWKKAISENRVVTIFEDDVICSYQFYEKSTELISRVPEDWDIIQWGYIFDPLFVWLDFGFTKAKLQFYDRRYADCQSASGPYSVVKTAHSFGTQAYSISPKGAQALLQICLPLRKRFIPLVGTDVVVEDTGIDNPMAGAYVSMQAFLCLPPLVVPDLQLPSDNLAAADPSLAVRFQRTVAASQATVEKVMASSPLTGLAATDGEDAGEPFPQRGEVPRADDKDHQSRYQIISGYRHRQHTAYFDDTGLKDEWQREVYLEAADLMIQHGFSTVYDVGCGSAYKLINYLGKYDTMGFDVEETVAFLRTTYPERKWMTGLVTEGIDKADLVICADVIEHVLDPDSLLHFISEIGRQYVVLSTPDRNLLCSQDRTPFFGPPENPYHVREWTFDEFSAYISEYFDIVTHRISDLQQGTQMVICQTKNSVDSSRSVPSR